MKVWFPTIKTESGSDIFVKRIVAGLNKQGIHAGITWFAHWRELLPFTLKNQAWQSKADIIHVNSWHGFPFARVDTPLVVTCHHSVHDVKYRLYSSRLQKLYHQTLIKAYERKSFQCAAAVTTVSRYTAQVVKTHFPFVEPVVIPNGIEIDFFTPAASRKQARKPFCILFVGNSSRRKGADLLPEIMRKLGDDFLLYYTSGLRDHDIQLPGNCVSLGYLSKSDLLQAYRECDAVIYPSRYEGFGYVACEAMACGKTVISSDTSALPELIENRISGLLCRNNNVDDFVHAIKNVAADAVLKDTLGETARNVIETQFSLEIMVSRYLQLYESLL